jgi:hypothetical protein
VNLFDLIVLYAVYLRFPNPHDMSTRSGQIYKPPSNEAKAPEVAVKKPIIDLLNFMQTQKGTDQQMADLLNKCENQPTLNADEAAVFKRTLAPSNAVVATQVENE